MSVTGVFFLVGWSIPQSRLFQSPTLGRGGRGGMRLAASIWEERELRVSTSSIGPLSPSFQRPSLENKPSARMKVDIWGLFLKPTSANFLRAPFNCSSRDNLGTPVHKPLGVLWNEPGSFSTLPTACLEFCLPRSVK